MGKKNDRVGLRIEPMWFAGTLLAGALCYFAGVSQANEEATAVGTGLWFGGCLSLVAQLIDSGWRWPKKTGSVVGQWSAIEKQKAVISRSAKPWAPLLMIGVALVALRYLLAAILGEDAAKRAYDFGIWGFFPGLLLPVGGSLVRAIRSALEASSKKTRPPPKAPLEPQGDPHTRTVSADEVPRLSPPK